LLASAIAGNLIAHLPTGSGKTWVGAQLLLCYAQVFGKTPDRPQRVGVFLVPTLPLVRQQAVAVRQQTGLRVGTYSSKGRFDMWSAERWATELTTQDVAVCTPQTLLDALRHGLMRMEDLTVLVFDECHHVVGYVLQHRVVVWAWRFQWAPAARKRGSGLAPPNHPLWVSFTLLTCSSMVCMALPSCFFPRLCDAAMTFTIASCVSFTPFGT